MKKRSVSSVRGARAGRRGRRTATPIDFSDIRQATASQLRAMRRVGHPPIGGEPRQLIAIRLDSEVLKKLRKEASRRNVGYQTLVNRVLAEYVRKHVA